MIQIYILTKKQKKQNAEIYDRLKETLTDLQEEYDIKYILEKIY